MDLPDSKDEIFRRVADKTGKSKMLVQYVIKEFESALRNWLTNLKGGGFVIKGLIRIGFNKVKANRILDIKNSIGVHSVEDPKYKKLSGKQKDLVKKAIKLDKHKSKFYGTEER